MENRKQKTGHRNGNAKPTVTMSVYAHWFNTRKTTGTMAAVAGAVFANNVVAVW